ncbi:MAG TPA: APC family permease [Mycobacteriales bacterium]|jgi:amino acid transporter
MSSTLTPEQPAGEQVAEKGLKGGALGLLSSIVIGVASTAPAYSLAATLGFIVVAIGLQTPTIVILAFVPMLFVAIGYSELNKADPDCGTTFTWATRAFGPKTGWLGGWAIVAADVLVMASLAQIAGQYGFLLFNADGIGHNPTSGWVLLVGVLWIVVMTYICYRGIEVSAMFQRILLSIELTMLLIFAAVALIKVGTGNAPAVHLTPSWNWFNPFHIASFSTFIGGILLMLFIYWGWDTTVAINEETKDSKRTPGRAAILSTVILLVTYVIVTLAAQSYAGIGTKGIGLGNVANQGDVLSVLGTSVFGSSTVGSVFTHLLIFMVLTSAAASTQTTILPTARTTLSMAVYRAIPRIFAKMHPRYLTPSVSTVVMGVASIIVYAAMNYQSGGTIIADSVTAIGLFIAFYYGLTGFACAWYYRKTLTHSARDLWMQGILPTLGGLILFFAMGWSIWLDWITTDTSNSYTTWLIPFSPHWRIGGVFLIAFVSAVIGVVLMIVYMIARPPFFKGEVLTRSTPTLVPDEDALSSEVPVAPADPEHPTARQ